jgi:Cellulose biosynthesis protein BcsS
VAFVRGAVFLASVRQNVVWGLYAIALSAVSCVFSDSALAEDTEPVERWRETWSGVDATGNTWLAYSGVTLAPFSHIHDDGIRIQFSTGYGQYRYSGYRHRFIKGRRVSRDPSLLQFQAATQFAEVLAGYLKRFGPLTAKAFVGAAYINHDIRPFDVDNEVQSAEWGPKVGLEFWLNIGDNAWGSLDSSWTSAHQTFSVRSRFGYRILPTLSIGPEAGINGNAEHINGRAGLFARYDWAGGEISASVGVSGDIAEPANPYGTLNYMRRF